MTTATKIKTKTYAAKSADKTLEFFENPCANCVLESSEVYDTYDVSTVTGKEKGKILQKESSPRPSGNWNQNPSTIY